LSEVSQEDAVFYAGQLDASDDRTFRSVSGKSGGDDSLQINYDADRLKLLETKEPAEVAGITFNPGNVPSPLICLFEDNVASQRFYAVLVHQARNNETLRNNQSRALREWARDQPIAVIAMGDFNYDFDYRTEKGNAAFDELRKDNILNWVKPESYVDTCWTDPNKDGVNDYPSSILDGFFVGGPAKDWEPKSRIIVRPGDFPDDETTSDHRPSELVFVPLCLCAFVV
jgi:hypothetical protein